MAWPLCIVLATADTMATSVLAFWLGCKIFEVRFEWKKAAALAMLMVLLKSA